MCCERRISLSISRCLQLRSIDGSPSQDFTSFRSKSIHGELKTLPSRMREGIQNHEIRRHLKLLMRSLPHLPQPSTVLFAVKTRRDHLAVTRLAANVLSQKNLLLPDSMLPYRSLAEARLRQPVCSPDYGSACVGKYVSCFPTTCSLSPHYPLYPTASQQMASAAFPRFFRLTTYLSTCGILLLFAYSFYLYTIFTEMPI